MAKVVGRLTKNLVDNSESRSLGKRASLVKQALTHKEAAKRYWVVRSKVLLSLLSFSFLSINFQYNRKPIGNRMNLQTFSELQSTQQIETIKLHRSPGNINHWFPMIHCVDGSVHLLIDKDEKEISKESIDALIAKLKLYGAKSAEIIF